MRDRLRMIRDILLLRDEAFQEFKTSPRVFERGLLIVLVVALLVGLVNLAAGLISDLRRLPVQREQVKRAVIESFQRGATYPADPELADMIETYIEAGIDIGFDIAALPTPLPRPVGTALQRAGAALSTPFLYLSGWTLFYTVLVLLAAKILGGQASVQKMLGCTALHVIPYILNVLGPIPWLGGLARAVAFIWGVLIFVKATAVANDITTERGLLATILPCAVALALILIAVPTGLIILMLTAG